MDSIYWKDLRSDMVKYVLPPTFATVRIVDRPKPLFVDRPKPLFVDRPKPLFVDRPKPLFVDRPKPLFVERSGRGLVRNDKNQIVDVRGNPLDPKLLRGRTKELEELRQTVVLSRLQRDAIVGSLLGDGHLESQNNGRSYHLRIEQSKKKEAYLMHLYETIYKPLVLQDPKEVKKIVNGKEHTNISFCTMTLPSLRFYGRLFYQEKTKIIPKNIHNLLNNRVLAYWYMDDGAKKAADRKEKRLHTEGFTETEVYRLRDALNGMGIETKVHKQNRKIKREGVKPDEVKTYSILYLTAKGAPIFTERIAEYVPDCMQSKL